MKSWKQLSLLMQTLCIVFFLFGLMSMFFEESNLDTTAGVFLILFWFCLGGIQIIDTIIQIYNAQQYQGLTNRYWHGVYLILLLIIGLVNSGVLSILLLFTSPLSAIIIYIQTIIDYKNLSKPKPDGFSEECSNGKIWTMN